MTDTCPACTAGGLRRWFTKATTHGSFHLWRCPACASAFVLPRPSDTELEQFYRDVSYRVMDARSAEERLMACTAAEARYPNSTLDAARIIGQCGALTRGRRFLDVGAGFGFFTREALRLGFRANALEPSPNCRDVFALLNGFEPDSKLFSPVFVRDHAADFDVVLLSQVLEHLPSLEEAVSSIRTLLGPSGIAAIAVPHFGSAVSRIQGRRDMFIDPPEHLNFFTRSGLMSLFERHGFRCEHSETISRFDPARLARRLPVAGGVTTGVLRTVLALADRIGRGMYLNAYFRRN
jgi:SAM-dependent methyltransferase